jgi:sigma-B regulation protein RsbU (phosphoserine phosphatase)
MVLGIMDDMTYDESATALAPGDILLLYTDGITEAMDADGNLFGKARLVDAVRHASPAGARDLIDAILAAVRAYVGDTPQADDLTIVTVKRN